MKLPIKTKAAILVENHAPLVVDAIELPKELHFGQVMVQIAYSGICGAQINEIEAAKGADKYLPHLLGHEASGEVLAIGEGVTSVQPGNSVVLHWRPGKGYQVPPAKYVWGKQIVNAGWVTTFQQYTVVSENRVTPVPASFDKKIAPLFGCAVTTAMGVINNDAQVKIGQSVVVIGTGGVGLNIVQAAHLVSAYPIIAVDIVDWKLEAGKKFGASHVVNSKKDSWVGDIKEIVGKSGADVVIDTTGNGRIIEKAYELTHADGRTILVGVPRKGDNVSIYTLPLHFKKVLKGSHGGSSDPAVEIPRYIKLIESHRLSLDGLITHEFPLEKINDAIVALKGGQTGRIVLKM